MIERPKLLPIEAADTPGAYIALHQRDHDATHYEKDNLRTGQQGRRHEWPLVPHLTILPKKPEAPK